MYSPAPFLISSAALTSIFSFFFGGYFREREWAYKLWIRFQAYESTPDTEQDCLEICADLEAKERIYRQAKGLLWILLLTIVVEFIVFQFYSRPYIDPASPLFENDASHAYFWFNIIIGIIVLINCSELIYILVSWEIGSSFPFFMIRKRVTGQERLAILWKQFNCAEKKKRTVSKNRIPPYFYKKLDE